MLLTVIFAFFAGLVTVASPCILPILPIALSAGVARGRSRPLGVTLGLVISFSLFTLIISQAVAALGFSANTLRLIAVAVIAFLGLALIVPELNARVEGLFARLPGLAPQRQRSGLWGGLLTGATLGLVWAPCAGPILAAITTLAATRQVTLGALAVTAAYALGVGLPLLLIAYGGQAALRKIPALARRSAGIQRTFGALMIATALLIAFNADVAVTAWATGALPANWNSRVQAFEETPLVRGQIDELLGRTGAPARALAGAATASAAGTTGQVVSGMPGAPNPAAGVAAGTATPALLPAAGAPLPAAGLAMPRPDAPDRPATPSVTAEAAPALQAAQMPPATSMPAPNSSTRRPALDLPDVGPAPDFTGITGWLNSPALHLADLRGKVVLVDFWTYSCINCIRTLPYVTSWYEKYHDQGLVVIGVHTPEFAFERETPNVAQATQRYNISYPVAQDNNYATWTAYQNQYWPAEYFIDAKGHLRHTHFGEGNYDESEQVIQELLAEAGAETAPQGGPPSAAVPFSPMQTPETYVGLDRQGAFASPERPQGGKAQTYSAPASLPLHSFALSGPWTLSDQFAQVAAAGDALRLHFVARDVYLVLASDAPASATVSLPGLRVANQSKDVDGQGRLHVAEARLYHLVQLPSLQEGTLELKFDQPGVRVYAFTFGS
jgi:cytochrome c biogenesis protein CcdA/thiol-disulfide isomerase/thioredoxin